MFRYKATTYEQMEKKPKEKKFKQNSYEEIRKLVEESNPENQEINSIVKNKNKKTNSKENIYNFKLFE